MMLILAMLAKLTFVKKVGLFLASISVVAVVEGVTSDWSPGEWALLVTSVSTVATTTLGILAKLWTDRSTAKAATNANRIDYLIGQWEDEKAESAELRARLTEVEMQLRELQNQLLGYQHGVIKLTGQIIAADMTPVWVPPEGSL